MLKQYTGIIHRIYGGKRWHERRGTYEVHEHDDQEIKFKAESQKKAVQTAIETMAQMINASNLPPRPNMNIIEFFLKKLESKKGRVSLKNIETGITRIVFD